MLALEKNCESRLLFCKPINDCPCYDDKYYPNNHKLVMKDNIKKVEDSSPTFYMIFWDFRTYAKKNRKRTPKKRKLNIKDIPEKSILFSKTKLSIMPTYTVYEKFIPIPTFFKQLMRTLDVQKPSPRGILTKRCSENIQQIYRKTPTPKCDFYKFSKQLYWNHTLAWVFFCKFAA